LYAANRGDSYGPNWVYSSTRGEIGLGVSTFTGITGFSAKESLKLINNADASFDILKGVRTGSKVLGSFTAGVNLGISFYAYSIDRTWGNAARVGVSGLALGLSLGGPYTAWAGFGISALDTFGAFDGFYDNLNFNQELYNSSGYIVTPSLTPAMPGYHFLRLRR